MTSPTPHPTIFGTVYAWLAAHVFVHIPSPVLELVSGLLLVALVVCALLLLHGWPAIVALATGGNILYEAKLDPNGWSLTDVLEREAGVIIGVIGAVLLLGL
jgi:hypothetical protein